MRAFRTSALLIATLLGGVLFWRLGTYFGLAALLVAISFAVVGDGNRILWLMLGPLVGLVIAAVVLGLYSLIPSSEELIKGLFAITMGTVAPGALLWSAAKFKSVRARSRALPLVTHEQSPTESR